MAENDEGALTQLRAFLAQEPPRSGGRLPPERELCALLGVSRSQLRRALAVLENEGGVWRHVGKGTFIGMRPVEGPVSVADAAARTSPAEIMAARKMIEPALSREAALNATDRHLAEIARCVAAARRAATWREYETCDNRFHRTVAEAAGNATLTALFDQLNAIRRAVVWTRSRDLGAKPPADHHSFAEHARILKTLKSRDPDAAEKAMHEHLHTVDIGLRRARRPAEIAAE